MECSVNTLHVCSNYEEKILKLTFASLDTFIKLFQNYSTLFTVKLVKYDIVTEYVTLMWFAMFVNGHDQNLNSENV